jgi:hypothetical protein
MNVPLHCVLTDILLISSDLIAGKSIPVLVGIVRLPVDPFLANVVLSLGACAGTVFSCYTSWFVKGMHVLGVWNRLLQLFFALFLSLSLLLSLSRGVHYGRGVVLSIIPAFTVVSQTLPQGESTQYVAFIASAVAYWFCMTSAVGSSVDEASGGQLPLILRGLNTDSPEDAAAGLWEVITRALQLFLLAFYASVQHAPTQVYCKVKKESDAVYASDHHAMCLPYALLVGCISALLRVSVWYGVCSFQDNSFHVMLENDLSHGGWPWACCVLFSVALLYSACWTATQIREQTLPLCGFTSVTAKLKLLVCALALATLYRQREPQVIFALCNGLSVLCVLVTGLTMRDP